MAKSGDPLSLDATSSTPSFRCINCFSPLPNYNHESIEDEEKESRVVVKALFSVFRLNFLDAFDSFELQVAQEEENPIALCGTCRNVLVNIFDLYTEFCQLTKVDSYLSKKLLRLHEIIESHRKKTIHCDLIQDWDNTEDKDSDDDPDSRFASPSDEEEIGLKVKFEYENCGDEDEADENEQEDNEDDQPPTEPEMKLEKDLSTENNDDDFKPSTSSTLSQSQTERVPEIRDKSRYYFRNKTKLPALKSTSRSKRIALCGVIPRPDPSEGKQTVESATTRLDTSCVLMTEQKQQYANTTTRLNTTKTLPINNFEKTVSVRIRAKGYLRRKSKVPNPCWHCELDFPTPEKCLEHTKNIHEKQFENAHLCLDCSKICPTLCVFTKHKVFCETIPRGKILPLQKDFQCEKCPWKFWTMKELQAHLDQVHSDVRPFSCDLCSFTTKTMNALRSHKKNKHDSDGCPGACCELCGIFLKHKNDLKRHLLIKHPQEGQEEERVLFLAREKALRVKRNLKKPNKPAVSTVCHDCQVDMFSRLALINHRSSFHQDSKDRNWVCDQCGRGFVNENGLKIHIQNVHVEDRKFSCPTCGKSFKSKHNLKDHNARSHTEEGRLRYNQLMRQKNQRRKIRERLLAQSSQDKISKNGHIQNDESSDDVS